MKHEDHHPVEQKATTKGKKKKEKNKAITIHELFEQKK